MLLIGVLGCLAALAGLLAGFATLRKTTRAQTKAALPAPMAVSAKTAAAGWTGAAKLGSAASAAAAPDDRLGLIPAVPAQAPSPILQLLIGLTRAFEAEKRLGYTIDNLQPAESFARLNAALCTLVSAYAHSGAQDWHRYRGFNDLHYVRHLVEEDEDFEMMVICWKSGQGSRVHNHAGSHCWLTPLEGSVEELQYSCPETSGTAGGSPPVASPLLPGVIAATAPCPTLHHTATSRLGLGQTGYINDFMALHAVRCDGQGCPGEGAATLHIYAPPIRRVKLYEPDNNRVVDRVPGFCSVRGKRLGF